MDSNRQNTFNLRDCFTYLRIRQERRQRRRERERQALLDTVRTATRTILPNFVDVRRAYLFGSVLRPEVMHLTSDIDIAIEGRLSAEDYFALWRQLEDTLIGWPIELVELDRDLHFAARVRETGVLFYERPDSDTESGH